MNRPDIEWLEGVPILHARPDHVSADIEHWLSVLNHALDNIFCAQSSTEGIRVLNTVDEGFADRTLRHAYRCRKGLMELAGGDAFAGLQGDAVILHLMDRDDYYRYVQVFYPEGEFGASQGMQIRIGYPHIVVWGDHYMIDGTIAHEFLHLALTHRDLPVWIEEGLAQMFEANYGGFTSLQSEFEAIEPCRRFWQETNLDRFWFGEAFQATGDEQKYAYMLAEVFARNLASRFGRRSFFKRNKETPFIRFLAAAKDQDAGRSAAQDAFGIGIEQIADEFLGAPR